jgi:hypothetical protein
MFNSKLSYFASQKATGTFPLGNVENSNNVFQLYKRSQRRCDILPCPELKTIACKEQ